MDVREKAASGKRLIDVNDIYSLFNQSGIARLHVSDIDTIPRVDSVEVVRCKVCKYHNKPPCPMKLSFNWTEDDDFCSYGERKEGVDNEH